MTTAPAGAIGRRNRGSWFDHRFRSHRASHSLYCFPFAGGTSAYYADWATLFTGPIELVPIQLPGRGPRMAEQPVTEAAEVCDALAAVIADCPTQPLLFGHSMGAILAFEVARRLDPAARGAGSRAVPPRPARHLFVSGRPAPAIARPVQPVSALPRPELVRVLRDYGAAGEDILEHEELLDLLLPTIRADFQLIEGYRYLAGPPLSCRITAWCGDSDPDVSPEVMRGWGEQTSAGFEFSVRPGGHFFLTGLQAEVAETIHAAVTGADNDAV
ncbi:MAG TPA: alpha/beta fold hydrolase [Actinocrinis sp.]|nr:alpha/beta fold hydrolase [Actinocrinis sp.]